MIRITVEGPDKAGKGYVIAAISRSLKEFGCDVVVQGADSHNASKLAKTDEEIQIRLSNEKVVVMEMQT